jgi:hypothetical protein
MPGRLRRFTAGLTTATAPTTAVSTTPTMLAAAKLTTAMASTTLIYLAAPKYVYATPRYPDDWQRHAVVHATPSGERRAPVPGAEVP